MKKQFTIFLISIFVLGLVLTSVGGVNLALADTAPIFVLKWGSDGTGNGEFSGGPYGVDTDSQGNVYVLGSGHIQKFNNQGVFITKSVPGTGGSGLAIDSQDNVYVVDHSIFDTVKKFDSNLNLLATIHQELITFSPWPGFKDIAIDSNDNLFIAARWKVVKMDTNGNIIKEWGSRCGGTGGQSTEVIGSDSQGNVCLAGQFADAQAIGVDNYNNVYVIEYWLHHVQVFDNEGNYIKKWGTSGSGDGYFRTPFGGAFDSQNNIYIADYYNNRIQKLTTDGNFILEWGSSYGNPGSEDGQLYAPRDVTIGSDGSIYVADHGNYRVQKFTYAAVPACTSESWSCTNWSVCSQDGSQTRSCSKISNCEGGVASPATTQSCTYTPAIVCGSGSTTTVILEDQNSSGIILSDNDKKGTLVYCVNDDKFNFAFSGKAPIANDWYALVVGENPLDHPETATILSYPRSDGNTGDITINGSVELNRDLNDAKAWLVLGGDLFLLPRYDGFTGWGGWQPELYLFGTSLIDYHDTNVVPACTASDWSCNDWSICSSSGKQTRTCNKISNCEGGTSSPTTTQSCTYTSTCTSDTWECGNWSECSVNGTQTRNCNKTYDCSLVDTPSPATTQSCTYTPPCTEDTWECEGWSECSPLGIKTRNCIKTYNCPTAETVPDNYQSCDYVSEDNSNIQEQHEAIVKSTVQLLCFNDSNGIVLSGSGTVINKSGVILTNKHVIKDRNKKDLDGCFVGFTTNINNYPDFSEVAFVLDQSVSEDMALLKIYNGRNNYSFMDINSGNSQNLSFDKNILAYGYPVYNQHPKTYQDLIQKITFSSGDFSGDEGWGYFKTTAMLEHGISGGGAYTEDGMFTGITTAGLVGKINTMGLILRIENVINWINSGGVSNNFTKEIDNFSSIANLNSMSVENFYTSETEEESSDNSDTQNSKSKSNTQQVTEEEENLITKVDKGLSERVSGKILLQVEKSGEAWYVYPDNQKKYYLGRPADAFGIMRGLGLGITNTDLNKIPKSDENFTGNYNMRKRLSGKILLQVQEHGEAWYIYPKDLKRYYMGRPSDAFELMRSLGLGITNNDIRKIDVGEVE